MRDVLIGEIFVDRRRIDVARQAGNLQKALQLAGKEQPAGPWR